MEMKTLGDPQTQPQSQNIATQISLHTAVDLESFKQLAKKYVLTGESRKFICLQNAQVGLLTLNGLVTKTSNRQQQKLESRTQHSYGCF